MCLLQAILLCGVFEVWPMKGDSTLYFLLDIFVVASCFDGRHSGFGVGAGCGGMGTAEASDRVSSGSTGLRKEENQVMHSS